MVTQTEERYSPLPQAGRDIKEIIPQFSPMTKEKLGYRDGAMEEEHPLGAEPFAIELAERASRGDKEALQLLSYSVVRFVPELLTRDEAGELRAFIDDHPELIGDTSNEQRAAKNDPRFMRIMERTAEEIFSYRSEMSNAHPFFRRPLLFSKLPATALIRAEMGHYLLPHIHKHSVLTAVYYVKAPQPNCGGLLQIGGHFKLFPPGTPDQVPITWTLPVENSLLILPAYLVHGVTNYFGDSPRLSIAFGM